MSLEIPTPKKKKRVKHDYIDNKKFTAAVAEYVAAIKAAERDEIEKPIMPHYVAEGFLLIAKGVGRKPNFSGYPFIDDMIMDGVENCVRYVHNFNINAETRSGKPSAFSYFTQIIHFAFIRRLQKEKKQLNIKQKFKEEGNLSDFADFGEDNNADGMALIEKTRCRDEFYREDRSLHQEPEAVIADEDEEDVPDEPTVIEFVSTPIKVGKKVLKPNSLFNA